MGASAQAAEVAGITIQQLHNLTTGKNAPTLAVATRLAQASGSELQWLVTGKGPRKRQTPSKNVVAQDIDARLMGRLVDAISRAYSDAGVSLPPLDLGVLAAEEYGAHGSLAATEDEQIALAKMVRTKHQRRLSAEPIAARKRGA